MGAWGVGSFENDHALDWVIDLEESKGIDVIESAIASIERNDGYLENWECSNAIAAAEIVAAFRGNARSDRDDEIKTWISNNPLSIDDNLRDRALNAVKRIASQSELQQLWKEVEEYEDWQKDVEGLIKRLTP